MSTYIAIAKLDCVNLVGDDEEVIPGNIGALKMGFQALLKEDAEDDARAAQKWAKAEELLAKDANDDTGAGAEGAVRVEDDFMMADLACPGYGG